MKNLVYILAAILILGCASNPPKPDMSVFEQHECDNNKTYCDK